MKSIKRTLNLNLSTEQAFHIFISKFEKWWPSEYTWSQDKLQSISIDARENGLCTEIGPFGFRCDWGRVIKINAPKLIVFKWQISPQRVPEPDPSKVSEVALQFQENHSDGTDIIFEHRDFENHGERAKEYRQAMDSEMGWDYILGLFMKYAGQS